MKFMHQVGEGEITVESNQVIGEKKEGLDDQNSTKQATTWTSEFSSLQKSDLQTRDEAASCTEEFKENYGSGLSSSATETSASEQDEASSFGSQFWTKLQDEWEKLAKDGDLGEHPWISEFSEYYDPFKVNDATSHILICLIYDPVHREGVAYWKCSFFLYDIHSSEP
jgi:hypothetical protein